MTDVRTQIEGFEGREHTAYPDKLTHGAPWTIGVGHTGPEVHPGLVWTDAQIDSQETIDIASATAQMLSALPWSATLDEPRQAVLIGMIFQMGLAGLVAFHHMLTAAAAGDFATASKQMMDSLWAKQTHDRAQVLATQMESGNWPA